MTLLTKAQVRTAVQQALDDPNAARWSASNLDVLIGLVQDTLWQQILDTFPDFLSTSEAETTDGSGIVLISALTAKRFYRIQKVTLTSSGAEYQPVRATESVPQNVYYIRGGSIVTVPALVSLGTTIVYSYLPTKFQDLATDATVLEDWPDGHESALIYASAAFGFTKGDSENMNQVARLADHSMEALLDHISRRYPISVPMRANAFKFATVRNPILGTPGPEA